MVKQDNPERGQWAPTQRSRTSKPADKQPTASADAPRPEPDIDPDRQLGPAEVEVDAAALSEAVVGWLVVVAGPGMGADFRLLAGMNTIGRGGGVMVDIAFGDRGIAEGVHCRVTFDPRSKSFFLSPGDVRQLTYLSDTGEPVLTMVALRPMQDFEIGATAIRFVPFCSRDFSWRGA